MKSIATILLVVFLFNVMAHHILYKAAQFNIRNEVQNQIDNLPSLEDLTVIEINHSDISNIEWKKQGKEFKYNNNMYDIVSSDTGSHSIKFYCLQDTKENKLNSTYAKSLNRHLKLKRRLKRSHNMLYFSDHLFNNLVAQNSLQIMQNNGELPISNYLKVPSPPPRLS